MSVSYVRFFLGLSKAQFRYYYPDWDGLAPAECDCRKLDLPATALVCSIRLAYQAADASHPYRAERARR
jgi:hypothetical protein